jgi:hypothetical protein
MLLGMIGGSMLDPLINKINGTNDLKSDFLEGTKYKIFEVLLKRLFCKI